jgi:radical SAM-linked protein
MTDPNQPPPNHRLRITFAKKSQVKYISHLDTVLAWERALRRAQIPLAYSQGFNPRPKIQVASGLPLGTIGSAEILDIIVTDPVDPAAALARIAASLPDGLAIRSIDAVPLKTSSLQSLLRRANYRVTVETELASTELVRRIETLLNADKVIQTRRRKKRNEEFDLRPWLHALRLEAMQDGQAVLVMQLTAGQFGNLRPEEVLKALDLADNWAEIERTRLIFEGDPLLA